MLTDKEVIDIITQCPQGRIDKTEFAKILREQTGRKLTNIRQFIINFNLRQHRNKHYNNKSYIQIQASNSAPLGFYYVEEVTK